MMKIAYLDPFSGVAGDMFLAALLDAGAIPADLLEERFATLGLGTVGVATEKVKRGALAATRLSFEFEAERTAPRDFRAIRRLIELSGLTDGERRRALEIFEALARAEAKIHDVPLDEVHFHEVGALDSILDVVGAAVAIEALEIDAWYSAKINLGSGFIHTDHGELPVPAPATLELLKGLPTYSSGIEAELTTPTGAAILAHLSPRFALPPARWNAVGYGAGARDLERPNALRILLGEALEYAGTETEEALVIETDIDDMSPQLLPYVQEWLFERGAQDVTWHPVHMKKGRLGMRLSVLSPPERGDALCELVFRETTTLGLRIYRVEKRRLEREIIDVETVYGRVHVKIARLGDRTVNVAPEYDDCERLARERGVPLKEVMIRAAERAHRVLAERS